MPPAALSVIPAVAIAPFDLRSGTGRPHPGTQACLGLLQAEHRTRRFRQNLHLQLVFGYAEPIQCPFLGFIE